MLRSGQVVKVVAKVLLEDVAAAVGRVQCQHSRISQKFPLSSLREHRSFFQGLGENSLLHVFCAETFLFYCC